MSEAVRPRAAAASVLALGPATPMAPVAPLPAGPLAADLRSLALLRVGLALGVLGDLLLTRLPAWTRLHTDDGWLTRADLLAHYASPADVSLYFAAGSPAAAGLLAAATLAAAVALGLGWHTRLAAVATWALVHSLHVRTPLLMVGGDQLLRLLLFWGMFLPWGRMWSLDACRAAASAPPPEGEREGRSLATAALVVQVVLLYIIGVAHKWGAPWWNGAAVFDALAMDSQRRWLGEVLIEAPGLCAVLTWATLAVEVGPPLVFLLWWRRGALRTASVAALLLLHAGLWSSLRLGIFPHVNVVALVALLPASWWERGGGARVARALDAWIEAARGRARQRASGRHAAADAAPTGGAAPDVAAPDVAAADAAAVAETSSCALGAGGLRGAGGGAAADPFRLGLGARAVVVAALAYVLFYNAAGLVPALLGPLRFVYPAGKALGLNQRFVMYAPEPAREEGWMVGWARLADGREVDLLAPDAARTLRWEASAPLAARYHAGRFAGHRDQMFLTGMWHDRRVYARLMGPFAEGLAREWELAGGARVEEVALVWMRLRRASGPPRVDWHGPEPTLLRRLVRLDAREPDVAAGGVPSRGAARRATWGLVRGDAPFPALEAARPAYHSPTAAGAGTTTSRS